MLPLHRLRRPSQDRASCPSLTFNCPKNHFFLNELLRMDKVSSKAWQLNTAQKYIVAAASITDGQAYFLSPKKWFDALIAGSAGKAHR